MSVEQRIIVTILVLASSASIMSTDLYTPSLPHMPEYFGTSAQAAKLTISLNLLAFGFAQLVFGPLSDRFGRRPVFLCGLVAFTLTSVACALAQTIEQLIVFRVLQGVAASVEAVVGLAIVRDLFFDTQRVKVLAIWGMSVALAPAVAPIIGGYIHVTAGWQANFWLVAGVGALITLLILARLAESTTPNPAAIKGRHVLASFSALLRSKAFLNHAVLLGASIGVIYAFVTAGPFILISHFGVATEHFGYYQASIVAAFFVGSLASNYSVATLGAARLLTIGVLAAIVGGLMLPIVYLAGWFSPITLTVLMSLLGLGLGPIFAVAPALALDIEDQQVGVASALIGAFQMIFGGLASLCITVFHDGTPRPMLGVVLLLVVIGTVAWWQVRRFASDSQQRIRAHEL